MELRVDEASGRGSAEVVCQGLHHVNPVLVHAGWSRLLIGLRSALSG